MVDVLVIKPLDRFVLTARLAVEANCADARIHWVSLLGRRKIKLNDDSNEVTFTIDGFKNYIESKQFTRLYIDNYFNVENIFIAGISKRLELYIVNYGVYFCKDEISYTFAKYFKLNFLLLSLTTIRLKLRDLYLSYYYAEYTYNLRRRVYKDAKIIFWNSFSQLSFKRDYPFAKTLLVSLDLGDSRPLPHQNRILIAPSILGGRKGPDAAEELGLWLHHVTQIASENMDAEIHMSLHPLYKGKYRRTFLEHGVVSKVFVGIPQQRIKDYDILYTDTSTLYWVARSHAVKAEFLPGYNIPIQFFDPNLVGRLEI